MSIEKIRGIIVDVRKHTDRHNVVTMFTRSRGRVGFLAPAGAGRSAQARNASLMPLTVIGADVNFNNSRELQFLGRFQREKIWKDLYFNPVKTSIAMFITEFVNVYTRHSGPDAQLWDFLVYAINRLDESMRVEANFHIAFMIDFMHFAGISPELSEWRPDNYFDMREGVMTIFPPTHREVLMPHEAQVLPILARMNLRTARVFRFNGAQRREILRKILKYYSLHFPGMGSLKSPDVLAELFS